MLRWARLVIVVLPLLALLASGSAFARVGKGPHKCEGMVAGMSMDDCMRGEAGGAPECPPVDCLSLQTFLLPENNLLPNTFSRLVDSLLPRDELDFRGLSGPPDLRPPIA